MCLDLHGERHVVTADVLNLLGLFTVRNGDAVRSEDAVDLDPMLMSGVVLGGANETVEALDLEDGILTAAEVTGLQLDRTRLVVLSACETGRGVQFAGQGVLDL